MNLLDNTKIDASKSVNLKSMCPEFDFIESPDVNICLFYLY